MCITHGENRYRYEGSRSPADLLLINLWKNFLTDPFLARTCVRQSVPAGWNSSISLIIKLSIIYINLLLCHRNFNRAFVAILGTTAGSTDLSYNAHYRPHIYHDDVVLIFVSLTSRSGRLLCLCLIRWPSLISFQSPSRSLVISPLSRSFRAQLEAV